MRRISGVALFLAVLCALAVWALGVIGPNVRVSAVTSDKRFTSDIRIFPGDPKRVLAASESTSRRQIQYRTIDGGVTWNETVLPLFTTDAFQAGPSVDWTLDQKAWTATVGTNSTGTQSRGRAYLSVDNGATWTPDGTFSGTQTQVDWPRLWSDKSSSSPFVSNLYTIWHNGNPAFMARRTAAGWQPLLQVSGVESVGSTVGADVRTNNNGDVFGYWPTTGNQKIFVVKSTNGGLSYGAPVQAATTFDSFDIGIPAAVIRRIPIYTSGAAWRTPLKNLVYVAWTDLSGDVNCTAPANEPGVNASSTCKTRIWFARSTNGGAAWNVKQLIFGSPFTNDQFNPWLSVDPSTGIVSVVFYIAEGANRQSVNLFYSASYNDGVSWATPILVTTLPSSGALWGNYNGMSSFRCQYYSSWTDRRGGNEEIWSAGIKDCP
jgi:hypothetical protein